MAKQAKARARKIKAKKKRKVSQQIPMSICDVRGLEDYAFFRAGQLFLYDDVTCQLSEIEYLIKALKYYAYSAMDGDPVVEEVTIDIHSPGGEVYSGFAIINAIEEAKRAGIRVVGRVVGMAASMAAVILSACSHRVAMKNSRIMIHEVSQFHFGQKTAAVSKEEQSEMDKVNKIVLGMLADNIGKSIESIQKDVHKTDLHMSPQEALEYGLVDEVLDLSQKRSIKKCGRGK